jgi:3-dehydroquinate dehydratase-2|tara:strand:+ start:256 stop:690 length:435 start_codon:yes stop_codon:yes gene_type:complete
MREIKIINGPNLNLLGTREPEIYGSENLNDLENLIREHLKKNHSNLNVTFFQSNTEGEIVDMIQSSSSLDGIIINAGGLSHTSISILDALLSVNIPKIEVHISNLFSREEFRQTSYVSKGVNGFVCGFGINGYLLAIDGISKLI